MISSIISRLVILICGTLYPAYASYKAVNTKNVKEYVKWMMYWIVFALFTCMETFTDVFLSWFPFYYEIKVVIVFWLLSPATKGSSILYRKFVHPMLHSREQEIDEYITRAKEQSYKQVLDLGSKGMSALMQTALKSGGGLMNHLRKSYSLGDISEQPLDEQFQDRDETESVIIRRRRPPSIASTTSGLYFSEVDVRHDMVAHIHSVEDINSGYASGEPIFPRGRENTTIAGPLRSRSVRVTRSTIPKKTADSDEHKIIYFINKLPIKSKPIIEQHSHSSSSEEFLDTFDFSDHNVQKIQRNIELHKKHQLDDLITQPLIKSNSIESLNFPSSQRAGKYNKKIAPAPPQNKCNELRNAAIKAKLVLQPGTVKPSPLNKSALFLPSHKQKSRSLSKSPDRKKNKAESSLLRLMTIPKRFTFWHKDTGEINSEAEKSSFWYYTKTTPNTLLVDAKPISKSAEHVYFDL